MLGSILGGIFGSNSAKKQRKMIEQQEKKNEQWYNRRYNESGIERADAQAAIKAMRDAQKERAASARGAMAVAGGSLESSAAEKAAQNEAMARVISGITANAEARKDAIESQYQARDADLANQKLQTEKERARGIQEAAKGLDSAIYKAADVFLG